MDWTEAFLSLVLIVVVTYILWRKREKKQVTNKIVLITGAGSGIGAQMARRFFGEGAIVILWDINESRIKELAEELNSVVLETTSAKHQRKAFWHTVDVTQREKVYEVAERVLQEIGPVDVLINNAGIVDGKSFLETSDESIEKVMNVNTLAHCWTAKAFLPSMIKQNSGHVVTISSVLGLVTAAKLSSYCASKFASIGFAEALRADLRARGIFDIDHTIVYPFLIDTGMFHGVSYRCSWLVPALKEEYVAERVLEAVKRKQVHLTMPRVFYLLPLLRLVPTGILDFLSDLFLIGKAMDNFNPKERWSATN